MTMNGPLGNDCLGAEMLAAFADRKLKRREMPQVLAHLDQCPNCRSALEAAVELRPPAASTGRWMALAAAIALIIAAGAFVRRLFIPMNTARLVSLAPLTERVVEPRLSGGFVWAPYRGPLRRADAETEARQMKLVGAAGDLVEQADAKKTASAQQAAGIGLLLVERPEDAVARLRAAAESSSSVATPWSDLAAAEYTAALRLGRASLYPLALAHTDRALAIDPNLEEALFNRALVLERLGLTKAAREAWDRYLRRDGASRWAAEAREHLQRLSASTDDALFSRGQARMEMAAARGDPREVHGFVDRFRQQSRTWAEAEYLGRWAAAFENGNEEDAARQLAIARAVGKALHEISGESLLRDAVAAVDGISTERRAVIATAHIAYRRGRVAYGRRQPVRAEPDLRRSAALFDEARTPMALVARYFAANTRFDQNDAAGARRELQSLLEDADQRPSYLALGAQIRWELTVCAMLDDDWNAAAALAAEAEQRFRRLGERSNLADMQMMLATTLIALGRPDQGWEQRVRALTIQSAEGEGARVPLYIGEAARMEMRTGRVDSARALLKLEEAAHRAAGDDVQLSNAMMREALIAMTLGETADAQRHGTEAMGAARRIVDEALRTRAVADAALASGAAVLETDPRRAEGLLSQAIVHYRTSEKPFYLPEAYLLRARAALRLGRRDDALRDLEAGIAEVERHRPVVAGPVLGTGVLDAREALFHEIVPLLLDRGDTAGAFTFAERRRARLSFGGAAIGGAAALRKKLAGSEAAVLEMLVLPRELITFAITDRHLTVARSPTEPDELAVMATREDDDAARRLYDLLIRPSEGALADARHVIIVADSLLQQVSFAALLDSRRKRRLIETMTVAMAPSAGSLRRELRTDPASVLSMALPSGEGVQMAALAEGQAELADVGRFYRSAVAIDAGRAWVSALTEAALGADVIHIAGHTERQPGLGDAALLFRGRATPVEPVTWSRIAAMDLGQPIVVLAACETLRVPVSPQAHALSLGGGFLAAGARAVIGTLTPVADNDAREIFRLVHARLAQGENAAAALRHAQLQAMAAGRRGWRSVAVITNRIQDHS